MHSRHRFRIRPARRVSQGLVALLLCLLPLTRGEAAEYLVPGDYDDIQSAIEAAEDGDTVLVDPGLYIENIDFLGKAITLRSVDGPESTTINGSDLTRGDDEGCVVAFTNDEGADTVIDGFSIRGGIGVTADSTAGNEVHYGGGIHVDGASPTIQNCIIFDNSATQGGGVWLRDSEAEILNCTIRDNEAEYGAALRVLGEDAKVALSDSTILDNAADWGGGIHSGLVLTGTELSETLVTVERTRFEGNSAEFAGGAINVLGHASVSDCTFVGNTSDLTGGALWIHGIADFETCVFEENSADIGAVVHNSGIDRSLTFTRCLFDGNSALEGGVYAGDVGTTEVEFASCTLVANDADEGGAVFLGTATQESEHSVTIHDSIIWDCGSDAIVAGSGTFDVTYSCIDGGHDGVGNVDEDPQFVDPDGRDYQLEATSPCVDAGNPDLLDGDGTVIDMGAFPFMHSPFLRGDVDGDGHVIALLDVIFLLQWGFSGGAQPTCLDGADVDDSGHVHPLVDTIYLLDWQFTNGDEPPAPGPEECGPDTTIDDVDCIGPTDCA